MKILNAIRLVLTVLVVAGLSLGVFAKTAPVYQNNPPVIDASGGPDGFGYTWMDNNGEETGPTYAWRDLTSTGTSITFSSMDDGITPLQIGFTFPFYGTDYTRLYVCTNGFISFNDSLNAASSYTNASMPGATNWGAMIAPCWMDLNMSTTGWVKYQNVGTDTLIIEWYGPGYSGTINNLFEAVLVSNGSVICHYNTYGASTWGANAYSIGIQNQDGSVGLQVSYNSAYLSSGRAVRFSLPTSTNFIYGNITAATGGAALDSVLVTVGPRFTYSSAGYYRIQCLTGMQYVSFSKPGWNPALDSVNVTTDSVALNKTMTHPILAVLPTSLEMNVGIPDSVTATFQATNSGDGAAAYTLGLNGGRPNWQVDRQVVLDPMTRTPQNFGTTYMNGYVWFPEGNRFQRLNPDLTWHDSSVVIGGATAGTWYLFGVCNDGQYLYGVPDRNIRAYDPTTGNNVTTANISLANVSNATSFAVAYGIAYNPDDDIFYVANWNVDTVFAVNRVGAVVARFGGVGQISGMAWHPEDPDGYNLWLFEPGSIPMTVVKLDVSSGALTTAVDPLPGAIGTDVASGGCFITDQLVPGNWVFGAVSQGSTGDRLELFSLGLTKRWSLTPAAGTISTSTPTTFSVKYRTHIGDAATTINGTVNLNLAAGGVVNVPITINVSLAAPEARNLNPNVFALNGAYPNPFNPTTTVRFSLATYSQVKLELYDINGRKVAELLNASLPAGNHRIGFKAVDLASGTYFVRMNAGGFNAVNKIVFLK